MAFSKKQWAFIIGMLISGFGLLFIDASIWQMMRGSLVIFAGILSVIFLKRRLHLYHWTGMMITVIGLALVGLKSVFTSSTVNSTKLTAIIGILLVFAGSFASAGQMIVEERFLKVKGFHPLHTVGMEGTFGTLLMILIVLPVAYFVPGNDYGSHENAIDALFQMFSNGVLLFNCILYIISIAFFNYCGLSVTKHLSAVHRTLIDALRNLLVWACGLILFYSTGGRWGEPLDPQWTLLQIDGFLCLILGTLIYNKVLGMDFIPCCVVSEEADAGQPQEVDESTNIRPSLNGSITPSYSDPTSL